MVSEIFWGFFPQDLGHYNQRAHVEQCILCLELDSRADEFEPKQDVLGSQTKLMIHFM